MTQTPVFIDLSLPEGPDRDTALDLVGQAFAPCPVVPIPGSPAADLLVADDERLAAADARPALVIRSGAILFAEAFSNAVPVTRDEAIDRLRPLAEAITSRGAAVGPLWSRIAQERLPVVLLRQWYPMLMMITVGRLPRRHEIFPASRRFAGLSDRPSADAGQIALLAAKADALADLYGQKYRSAFVGRFFLSAVVSVFVAMMLFLSPSGSPVAYGIEFIASMVILASFIASRKGDWKGRWMTCRYIAESLRTAEAMGRDSTGFLLNNRDNPEDPETPEERLIDWCARILIAQDAARSLDDRSGDMRRLLQGQIDYHDARLTTLARIERRLGVVGLSTFAATMLLSVTALAGRLMAPDLLAPVQAPVALALGILPALGATIFAIRVQANFNAEALHSNAMAARLRSLVPRLDQASQATLDALARRFSDMQRAEHGDWRQMQQGRALDLP